VLVGDPQHPEGEDGTADAVGGQGLPAQPGALGEPVEADDHADAEEQVDERDAEPGADRELPEGGEPSGEDPAGALAFGLEAAAEGVAVAAGEHGEGEDDAAAGEHLEVPGLAEFPWGVREGRGGDGGAGDAGAELAQEGVGAEEREGERADVEDVVDDERAGGAGDEEGRGGVAHEGVGEEVGVVEGPEAVGVPDAGGVLAEGVADPAEDVGEQERVAGVVGDAVGEVAGEGPGHGEGEEDAAESGEGPFAAGGAAQGAAEGSPAAGAVRLGRVFAAGEALPALVFFDAAVAGAGAGGGAAAHGGGGLGLAGCRGLGVGRRCGHGVLAVLARGCLAHPTDGRAAPYGRMRTDRGVAADWGRPGPSPFPRPLVER
jgi:hypothetical protein